MIGELNLAMLISSMQPVLHADEYVFCSVPNDTSGSAATLANDINTSYSSVPSLMEFKEKEGTTLIIKRQDAELAKLSFIYPCKMITLNIHSSLDAIGFLAAITKDLAAAGISVNAVSAFYHDHIFVPTEKAAIALQVLTELSQRADTFDQRDSILE